MMGAISATPDEAAALGLIKLVTDPQAYEKRIQELTKHRADAAKVLDEARIASEQAEKDRRAAEAMLSDANAAKREQNEWAGRLAGREAAVSAREDAIKNRETSSNDDIRQREAVVAQAEVDLKRRQDALAPLEKRARDALAAAEAVKTDYEARIGKLRAVVG